MNCKICQSSSYKFLLDRKDFEFDIDYKLDYYICNNTSCGHVFSYPNPENSIISSFYKNYTTHSLPTKKTKIQKLIYLNRKRSIKNQIKKFTKDSSILDYGSGNGYYSNILTDLSYNNILAFDFDEKTKFAFENSSIKFSSNEENIFSRKFDFIMLNHVIEHIPDPKELLIKLYNILNKGGVIYIRTPNNMSVCSYFFELFWRGWETPRHLNIFNFRSITKITDHFESKILKTSNQMFLGIFLSSFNYRYGNKNIFFKIFLGSYLLFKSMLISNSKEELVCIIKKP